MLMREVTQASPRRHELAEGPWWHPDTCELTWVDVDRGEVLLGALVGDQIELLDVVAVDERTVGAAIGAADGGRVVLASDHLAYILPGGEVLHAARLLGPTSRFNDAACDPQGRLLAGTVPLDGSSRAEHLHRIEPDGSLRAVVDGVTISNGLAWSPDGRTMYYADSKPGVVWAFPYGADGSLGSPTPVVDVRDSSAPGIPDGLCVDAEGALLVAFWGAGEVRRLSPRGEILTAWAVPAPNTSSVAFVGPLLDRVVITTARAELTEAQLERWPGSGLLYLADTDVPGLPRNPWSGSADVVLSWMN
ncbi:MAG: SMP-30/gluconolactonase/LRE family protein [Actinomycetota bacterium]